MACESITKDAQKDIEITVKIDGKMLKAQRGATILEIAQDAGIKIPTLCYIKGLDPDASCRMCIVHITNARGRTRIAASCSELAQEGDVIFTNTPEIRTMRKVNLENMLLHHRVWCFSCKQNGACEFQDLCVEYDAKKDFSVADEKNPAMDFSNEFFEYDSSKCIQCHRCVNVCAKLTGRESLGIMQRSDQSFVAASNDKSNFFGEFCESCGNCVQACPTGALSSKRRQKYRPFQEFKEVQTTCPHCGTGCQLKLIVKDGKIVDAVGADGKANHGLLCVKGRNATFDFVQSEDRLKHPLVRNAKTGKLEKATWDEALDAAATGFMHIKEQYSSSALAGFACSRSTNEDVYMVQKMIRTCFGNNNTDNCARVCHSASVTGLGMTLGSGAMTNTIEDITHEPDCIMLVGSNPEEAHPIVGMQIRQALRRGCKLIVVDPRDIDLAKKATLHLKLRPGTNVAFANGMMNVMINEGLIDKDFIDQRTEGFDELREIVMNYTPDRVADICHINVDDLKAAARMYAKADKAPIIYCLGVTEHSTGTEGVMSMSNMACLVGKLGRYGCGVNPLRGQNNVQGACDMGAMPTDFPGYQKINAEGVVEKFEKAWGVNLSREQGEFATDAFQKMITGDIRGLYICGENPIRCEPDTSHIVKALKNLDFLVVQDLFLTETAEYADVVLPGVSYAEKEGTFTNTERRVQRVRKAIEPVGDARPDTWIVTELMRRMAYPQQHLTPAQIMDEIASVVPNLAGINHARLDADPAQSGLQWPCPSADHPGTPILHTQQFTRGRAWLYPAEYIEAKELPDKQYPLLMMTGRVLYHYNSTAMTARTEGLNRICGKSFIELHVEDAKKAHIKDGDKVVVESRRGKIKSTARVSNKVSAGECWMPFHFQDGNCNWLTNAALDKYAHIPEYKVCAVKVSKA